jgi:hypothetical protein
MPFNRLAVVSEFSAIVESPRVVGASDGTYGLARDAQREDFVKTPPLYDSRSQECTVELARQARIAE